LFLSNDKERGDIKSNTLTVEGAPYSSARCKKPSAGLGFFIV